MKATLEIPDPLFRRAKAKAAEQRIPLRQFVSEAVAEKLEARSPARQKTRMKLAGSLRHLSKETARINTLIEREFETIEPVEPGPAFRLDRRVEAPRLVGRCAPRAYRGLGSQGPPGDEQGGNTTPLKAGGDPARLRLKASASPSSRFRLFLGSSAYQGDSRP